MASIGSDSNGRKRILFVADEDGSRKTIRLGRATMPQANTAKQHIEELISALKFQRSPEDLTAKWVGKLDDVLHTRIAGAGLVKPRDKVTTPHALGGFFDRYIADRTDSKPRTIINLKQARADVVKFFGETKDIREITEGDAEEFWRWMRRPVKEGGRGLGVNTARRIIGRAKQLFRFAIRKRIMHANPFEGMECHVKGNAERSFFITREMAQKVLDECPDAEWRLIFTLSRYGGLRCPSEHLALRWGDVDWDGNRLTVHSPKTEHIEGKESRVIPLFPELRKALLEMFEQAPEGTEHVISTYRDVNKNFRTRFERIIKRAGLTPWPKLFHNLRATRQTELEETFPSHVVCAWIGNSEDVARKHYLQVTDSHFAKALVEPAAGAAQNQAQYGAEPSGTVPLYVPPVAATIANPAFSGGCDGNRYPQGESNPCMQTENLPS
jgi:integrase